MRVICYGRLIASLEMVFDLLALCAELYLESIRIRPTRSSLARVFPALIGSHGNRDEYSPVCCQSSLQPLRALYLSYPRPNYVYAT